MKRRTITAVVTTMALCAACLLGGCAAQAPSSIGDGQPAPMPQNHQSRYSEHGPNGCYGCHGANEKANPQLVQSVAMPEDHYAQDQYATMLIDPGFNQCITCHPQS